MLLKSRSRTLHPDMLLLHIKYATTCFSSIHPITRMPPDNCSKLLLLSLKSFVPKKRHVAMQKLFIKEKEKYQKIDKFLRYLKQWVLCGRSTRNSTLGGTCLHLDTKYPESELNRTVSSSTPSGRTQINLYFYI
jgi:hypothetical protein